MPSYICATHYFGCAGMGNFWNTYVEADVPADLKRIKADGFTHIILLVPWALFQSKATDAELNPLYLRRLDRLFRRARDAGLKVILRVGYLWETAPVRYSTFSRIMDLPTSKPLMQAWSNYFRMLWEAVGKRPAFEFAFVSWEDWYWPIYRRIPTRPEDRRLEYARKSGYQDFLKLKYELPDLRQRLGVQAADWDAVPVPPWGDPAVREYAAFVDTVLSDRLFSAAAENFPQLSFEFRIDDEWFKVPGVKRTTFFAWNIHRDTAGRQITYYHPHVGSKPNSKHTAEHAAALLEKVIHRFAVNELRWPKVFLDQFNFYTQNPEYPTFSSIMAQDREAFLTMSEPILAQDTSGYGVWGYRDWLNDKVYNGTFEFGLDGWTHEKLAATDELKKIRPALVPSSRLEQQLHEGKFRNAKVLVQGNCKPGTVLQIFDAERIIGDVELNDGDFEAIVECGEEPIQSVGLILRSGHAVLSRIAVYSAVLSSGLYGRNFEERPAVAAIRRLNRNLSRVVLEPEP